VSGGSGGGAGGGNVPNPTPPTLNTGIPIAVAQAEQLAASGAAGNGSGDGGFPAPPTSNDNSCGPQPASPFSLLDLANLLGQNTSQQNEKQDNSSNQSFTADTRVALPGGKTATISSLKPGDKVLSTNTATGKTSPETVAAVLVRHDTDLYNLTVKTAHGKEVIHTTSNHLFWDPSRNKWVQAAKLRKGEHLKTPHGTVATADGGTTPKDHDGWMWDLTIPGNNDHDFYVAAGTVLILVHNADLPDLCGPVTKDTHYVKVTVRDADGNIIDTYELRSGSTTPEEAAMGEAQARQVVHTENRAARASGGVSLVGGKIIEGDPFFMASPVPEGGSVTIEGTNEACSNCKGAMNRAAEDTGSTFFYQWVDGDGDPLYWRSRVG
jgi:hypothetical protein